MDNFIPLSEGDLPDPDKNDNGYVHYNSGIPNKAAYLIVEGGTHHGIKVEGIGREKAEQIYYLALTVYLSSSTTSRWTFKQARYALLNACRQLYGDAGAEYRVIKNAWSAVGIGLPAEEFNIIQKEVSPNLQIPDLDPAGIQSTIHIQEQGLLKGISLSLNIKHTYIGDLRVGLTSPSGEQVILHDRQGRSSQDIIKTYDLNSLPSLMTFMGDQIHGEWVLNVSDHAKIDTGKLVKWALKLSTQEAEKKTFQKEVVTNLTIPDNDPEGIESLVCVDESGIIVNLDISIDITHPYIGDLRVILSLPSGVEVKLHDRTGFNRHDIKKTFSTKSDVSLQFIVGSEIRGEWRLRVMDLEGRDVGKLNKWVLDFIYE